MTKQSDSSDRGRVSQPSNDTVRIASALKPLLVRGTVHALGGEETRAITLGAVEAVIAARALRAAYWDADLFGDPAWDILLGLLHAELTKRRSTPLTLGKAANLHPGAAKRWMAVLSAKGLCDVNDPTDPDSPVELSAKGGATLRDYFASLAEHP